MRKIQRRDFLKAMGLATAALGLTACGGSGAASASSVSSAPASSSSAPSASAPPEAAEDKATPAEPPVTQFQTGELTIGEYTFKAQYGVTTLDAVVESIVCMKFEEILECSKSNLLEEMRRKDLDAAKKEATRWKEEVQTKVDEQDALKKEMIRVIQGTSGLDREMIQQMVNENKEALLTAQTNLADSEKKLKEIEEQNQKAERNCSDLFTWASTYKGASFERRQAILKQFIKEVRVGRDYNIEIVLNVPLDEFEEFKRHAASAGRGKNQKNKSQNPQKVGRCTSNAGIVVLDKTAGETISIVPKNAAHAILRC